MVSVEDDDTVVFVDEGEVGSDLVSDFDEEADSEDEPLECTTLNAPFEIDENAVSTVELTVGDHWGPRAGEDEPEWTVSVEADTASNPSAIFHEEARKTVEELTEDLFVEAEADLEDDASDEEA